MNILKSDVRILQVGMLVLAALLIWHFSAPPSPVSQIAVTGAQPITAEPMNTESPAPPDMDSTPAASLEEKWGIEVVSVSLTNNSAALQVKYTVVAPEKTLELAAASEESVYLIDDASGARLPMIKPSQQGGAVQGASLRTTRRMARYAGQFPPALNRLVSGATYSFEIPNYDWALQTGRKVSFVIGDIRQDNLFVQ